MRQSWWFCLFACAALAASINNRPIVGVLTQPQGTENSTSTGQVTYIAADYVKFLEQAGARVVPVHYDSSAEELTARFRSINGLLLPGGGSDLSNTTRLRQSAQFLYDLAIRANDVGDRFPIWGTCMGLQLLTLLTAQDDNILCQACFDSEGTPMPLKFVEPAASESRLLGGLWPALKQSLTTENLTENSHHDGIYPRTYKTNQRLSDFYNVLTTNVDYAGEPFTSTIEAKKYPFAATQWHPEKNNFEWSTRLGPGAIPHSADAVLVSQYVANFVVGEARRSEHRFNSTADEVAALIWNYQPRYEPQGYFEQVYLWNRSKH